VSHSTREKKADYDDFAEVTYEMAAEQIAAAEKVIAAVERYLGEKRK
jgi:HEPN domain-containing protein